MTVHRAVLQFLRLRPAAALFALLIAAPMAGLYSIHSDYYRRVNAQESFKFGLAVAGAVNAFWDSNGHLPPSASVLHALPERPTQLADWTLNGETGLIRLRVADVPRDSDTLDLVPTAGPGGRLVYSCLSVNIPEKFSPTECKSGRLE